jgi:RNA polymerase sigma-70 factor (ECF subfamily)
MPDMIVCRLPTPPHLRPSAIQSGALGMSECNPTMPGVRTTYEDKVVREGDPVDKGDFDQFYAATAPRLVGQLTAMLGSFTEAQDCVQEAFVKAWLHRRELDADGNPEAWVRRTAWRVGMSRWRAASATLRAYRRRGVAAEVQPPDEDNAMLVAALRTLSADQRQAIVLHHLCDLSVEAVARETGAPTGTIKARLTRGRAALAQALGPESGAARDDTHGEANHV